MKQWLRTFTVSGFLLSNLMESIIGIKQKILLRWNPFEIWDGFTAVREESWTTVLFLYLLSFCFSGSCLVNKLL